ncbi:hypothetical protein LTR10_017830 [Elasticomyces elasticus]|uniref:FAM192A/Fyv6 N-terminal domain-containing protein n=1 Tax=Exophiala sideris TaxID=1016849 RepID=A0ABR0J297_9EURO|nr:hypothetical protein LTR10_017830 [Elasticomyces elasticus]KAK5023829.1 hypothetical protein LTS07_008954 [Exophiala sideris]KAK5030152.1 hypothetical protein LTR13_008465 [Exophiala sideris]KAK5053647.1 hypothetical protein LTR69_009292 [Exophiala sideris]KAK5179310.1 hypothetical protein LTR44_008148 [Eurotiomycetes sp. CCFEE 6388]
MSGRFVSVGGEPVPEVSNDAWAKAKQDVEAQRKPKQLEEGTQEGGKSLYEVLQANKAAKQEAFEEAARLKNQFRALDEDEVDFLDSVLESSRAKEDAVKKETADQLEAFRKQRAAAEQALSEQPTITETGKSDVQVGKSSWTTQKKKRRRDREDEAGGPKLRKLSSSVDEKMPTTEPVKTQNAAIAELSNKGETTVSTAPSTKPANDAPKAASAGLGLVGYDSDEDD